MRSPTAPSLAGIDAVTVPERGGGARAFTRVMTASLVVIGALVWWESRVLGWAIASSLVALAALLAVSTMMLGRGVLVPTAGPGAVIIAGMLSRQALEAVFRVSATAHGAATARDSPAGAGAGARIPSLTR